MKDQDLLYNILAPGIIEFTDLELNVNEDLPSKRTTTNRITSAKSVINGRVTNIQDLMLRALVVYADTYQESIHTLQWQEKYQLLAIPSGTKIDNLNFNASAADEKGVVDYLPFSRKIVCLGFINSEYIGGDLVFNYQDLTYRPKPGTILMLPADYMYSLSVRPIVSGTMLCLFTAFHGGKDIDEELYEEKKGEEFIPLSYMR